jgi:hypothetical protein
VGRLKSGDEAGTTVEERKMVFRPRSVSSLSVIAAGSEGFERRKGEDGVGCSWIEGVTDALRGEREGLDRLKGGADLCKAKVDRLAALASVVAAGIEGVVMERSGDLSVSEVKGLGGGDSFGSESTEEGGVLVHRFLMIGRKGGEEGGVAFFEDFGASSALVGKGKCPRQRKGGCGGSVGAVGRSLPSSDAGRPS